MQAIDSFFANVHDGKLYVKKVVDFPYVTIPNLDIHGTNTRVAADTLFFFYKPIVTNEQRFGMGRIRH